MRSPVNFMRLEKELKPLAPYLQGKVLNAGCGSRDISDTLTDWGAATVDNCDIATPIEGAFICELSAIPRPDALYDAILCNAVLEHVLEPDAVMREFYRLLKPGGYCVIAIPFLQPYHPCPTDYQRYTVDGMDELGKRAGFTPLSVRPLHSLAQTLGWVVWEHLLAKKNKLLQYLLWGVIYTATRIWQCSSNVISTANTFQMVLQKLPEGYDGKKNMHCN